MGLLWAFCLLPVFYVVHLCFSFFSFFRLVYVLKVLTNV